MGGNGLPYGVVVPLLVSLQLRQAAWKALQIKYVYEDTVCWTETVDKPSS